MDTHTHTHKNGNTSDHLPVSTTILPTTSHLPLLPTVPSWVSKHPSFTSTCQQLLDSTFNYNSDIMTTHKHHKDIMYTASQQIILNNKQQPASTTAHKKYCTLMAFRHLHLPFHPATKNALQTYQHLQQFYDKNNNCTHPNQLHDHLTTLTTQLAEERLQQVPQHPNEHSTQQQQQTNNLTQWLTQWSTKKRHTYNLQITDQHGQPATSTYHAAQLLHDHWQRIPCGALAAGLVEAGHG